MLTKDAQLEMEGLQPKFDPKKPYALPSLPPRIDLTNPAFFAPLVKARTAIAHLEGLSAQAKNPLFLISPFVTRESVESSGIENVHTTVAEVYRADLLPKGEQKGPEKEVLNYRNAILWATRELDKVPLSNKIILGVFRKLMPEFDGAYRRTQNQITSSVDHQAIYTPPSADRIGELIANWEKFVHAEDEIDPLLKCIICHYQFEAIHPFNDGNGRTGRILMILQMMHHGLLSRPILFVSAHILRERESYYRVLRQVTETGNWSDYILYMLEAFHTQAERTKDMIEKIHRLFEDMKRKLKEKFPRWYDADIVEHLFAHPITNPTHMASELKMTYQTASKYLKLMQKEGLLKSQKAGTFTYFMNARLLTIART